MIPRFSTLVLAFVVALAAPGHAQEDAKEVPPVGEAPEFAGKSIDQMTADEVLKLVRFSYTLFNRDFTGNLLMGITKKVPFILSLKPESIRFIFDNPAQIVYLDTRDQRFGLFEGVGGAEMQPPEMGFQAIRVKVVIEGDATREQLDEIVKHANYYSPVANSMRNPIAFEIGLA